MTEKLDQIREDIKELRAELKDYAQLSISNKNDIAWIKGSFKIVVTIATTILSGALVFFLPKN